jgi:hypothetical protein
LCCNPSGGVHAARHRPLLRRTLVTEVVDVALQQLDGPRYNIPEAISHVPDSPGLYAIYSLSSARHELGLDATCDGKALYVGKAEYSLVTRDLRTHFASGRTGSSTVRRSFAALLRASLGLRGIPRNLARPERPANFALSDADDAKLTDWMHRNLQIAVCVKPSRVVLDEVETAVLARLQPPLNIAKIAHPLPTLRAARKVMADDAREWVRTNGFKL